MWRRIEIENFRAFERFELDGLGRVNLLVGENNSGKTSVLEAIDLLASRGDLVHIWETLARRGEAPDDSATGTANEVDVTHLFYGHEPGSFVIRVSDANGRTSLAAELTLSRMDPAQVALLPPDGSAFERLRSLYKRAPGYGGTLTISSESDSGSSTTAGLPVGLGGRLDLDSARMFETRDRPTTTARFLTTHSLNADLAAQLFGQIALEDDESSVIQALRSIEPGIERIALVSRSPTGDRGGLAVRLAGVPRRVPIGSLGDGIWRLLALTLCLVRAKGGVLLVDEIDTGMHYSVLSKMWKLVMETAERLDVQVFATTHSRDCYESLAAICREEPEGLSRVSIQRLERDKTRAVAFTEREIVLAAERGIEVR